MRFLLIILLFPILLNGQVLTESNLPIFVINTNGITIQDEPKQNVELGIINNPSGINNINDPFNDFEGKIGIEYRGQSSQWFPKKGLGFEIRDEEDEDFDASILGLPAESDYVLHAPFSDKSLIRNALTYILAGQIMDWAPRVRFCELVIDGDYQGIYLLVEKIKRGSDRVDVAKLKEVDIEGEEVEGGYIIRFDKIDEPNEALWYSDIKGSADQWQDVPFVAAYPKFDKILPEQKAYIREYITTFEQTLDATNFTLDGKHYSEYIDMQSFIDFILMNELTRNVDGYRISSYMHKNKADVLKMGPVWDFNLALGNADYCQGGSPIGWEWNFNSICPQDGFINHFWWTRFIEDETFTDQLGERYNALRENVFSEENIEFIIDSLVEEISPAVNRNFQKWQILGTYIWPNNFVGNSHAQEIQYIKGWLNQRLDFMDTNLPNGPTIVVDSSFQFVVTPNPSPGNIRIDLGPYTDPQQRIHFFDSYGNKVFDQSLTREQIQFFDLNLVNGLYYYTVVDFEGNYVGTPGSLVIIK